MRPSHHLPSLLGPLVSIVLLVLLVLAVAGLIWWLVKRRQAPKAPPGPRPQAYWQPGPPVAPQQPANAVQILDERLARGDIDVDDYLTRRAALLGDRPANGTEFQHDQAGAPPRHQEKAD